MDAVDAIAARLPADESDQRARGADQVPAGRRENADRKPARPADPRRAASLRRSVSAYSTSAPWRRSVPCCPRGAGRHRTGGHRDRTRRQQARQLPGAGRHPVAFHARASWAPTPEANELILGGPMMGMAVASLDVPVTKGVSGIVVYEAGNPDQQQRKVYPCIGVRQCVEACPMHLNPSTLGQLARPSANTNAWRSDFHLNECFECGCCSLRLPVEHPAGAVFPYRQGHQPGRRKPHDGPEKRPWKSAPRRT